MYHPPFLPADFEVPTRLETPRLRLRPLTIHDAVKDFAAVMESEAHLKTVFRPGSLWPTGLTLEENILDCAWHQKEFQLGSSFTFTVADLEETAVLGCLYIYPTRKTGYDAEISCWVRKCQLAGGLDQHLFETVENWIATAWPLTTPPTPAAVCPGRTGGPWLTNTTRSWSG